jgi:hypothetical protein
MIITVEGTKSFNDYDIFMRAMGVALSSKTDDPDIQVWSAGPHTINSFTAAFCNSSENFLKQKGYKISFSKAAPYWIAENISYVNYFAFFSSPKENLSRLAQQAQLVEGCEVGLFRYQS